MIGEDASRSYSTDCDGNLSALFEPAE